MTIFADILQNRQDSLWFGGRVAEVEYKGYTFILGAYGDVRATLLDEDDHVVAEMKDKENNGRFAEFALENGITTDDQLHELDSKMLLVFEGRKHCGFQYFLFTFHHVWSPAHPRSLLAEC